MKRSRDVKMTDKTDTMNIVETNKNIGKDKDKDKDKNIEKVIVKVDRFR